MHATRSGQASYSQYPDYVKMAAGPNMANYPRMYENHAAVTATAGSLQTLSSAVGTLESQIMHAQRAAAEAEAALMNEARADQQRRAMEEAEGELQRRAMQQEAEAEAQRRAAQEQYQRLAAQAEWQRYYAANQPVAGPAGWVNQAVPAAEQAWGNGMQAGADWNAPQQAYSGSWYGNDALVQDARASRRHASWLQTDAEPEVDMTSDGRLEQMVDTARTAQMMLQRENMELHEAVTGWRTAAAKVSEHEASALALMGIHSKTATKTASAETVAVAAAPAANRAPAAPAAPAAGKTESAPAATTFASLLAASRAAPSNFVSAARAAPAKLVEAARAAPAALIAAVRAAPAKLAGAAHATADAVVPRARAAATWATGMAGRHQWVMPVFAVLMTLLGLSLSNTAATAVRSQVRKGSQWYQLLPELLRPRAANVATENAEASSSYGASAAAAPVAMAALEPRRQAVMAPSPPGIVDEDDDFLDSPTA